MNRFCNDLSTIICFINVRVSLYPTSSLTPFHPSTHCYQLGRHLQVCCPCLPFKHDVCMYISFDWILFFSWIDLLASFTEILSNRFFNWCSILYILILGQFLNLSLFRICCTTLCPARSMGYRLDLYTFMFALWWYISCLYGVKV